MRCRLQKRSFSYSASAESKKIIMIIKSWTLNTRKCKICYTYFIKVLTDLDKGILPYSVWKHYSIGGKKWLYISVLNAVLRLKRTIDQAEVQVYARVATFISGREFIEMINFPDSNFWEPNYEMLSMLDLR